MALASDRVGQDFAETLNSGILQPELTTPVMAFAASARRQLATHSMGYFARPVLCDIHALCGCFDNSLSKLCHAERANANLCDK